MPEIITRADGSCAGSAGAKLRAVTLSAFIGLTGVLSGCVGSGVSTYLANVQDEIQSAPGNAKQSQKPSVIINEQVESAQLPQPSGQAALPGVETGPKFASVLSSPALGEETVLQATPLGTEPLPGTIVEPQTAALAALPELTTTAGFAIGTESTQPVDPVEQAAEMRVSQLSSSIKHGQCKSGWGPKPKRMAASRVKPGDPYYIEIRMRQTPLLPVGHTYVAYGRLNPFGEPLDEALIMLAPFGGYAGAALASGVPMPGVLTPHPDDCVIEPDAGYRISLNAQQYEKLLMEVAAAKSDKPSYLLFTNNCNHFASRIAASVGIKPPKNIYVPALQYIYDMIEANEGQTVARR